MEEEANKLYRRPQMTGQAREVEEEGDGIMPSSNHEHKLRLPNDDDDGGGGGGGSDGDDDDVMS